MPDEIIGTGIRSRFKQSLDVKRDANRVVDAISAEDVGKFPDINFAESLQDEDTGSRFTLGVRGKF